MARDEPDSGLLASDRQVGKRAVGQSSKWASGQVGKRATGQPGKLPSG